MANVTHIDIDTAQSSRYEAPAFDPGVAFSWTLRSGEIALREQQRRRDQEHSVAAVDRGVASPASSPCYDAPAFDARGAFSWTLRSREIARRLQRQSRPAEPRRLELRAA